MLLQFERVLPCPPETAWSLLNDPRLMALWSTARIESLSLGDGGHPAGVGALRRVHVPSPGRPVRLDEVVLVAEPPSAFAYRVIAGAPVRSHHGRITCASTAGGTHVRWDVSIEPQSRALGLLIRRALVPQLEASLERLERAAVRAEPLPHPPLRSLDESSVLRRLERDARACLEEQRELAEAFDASDAPQRWFTRVYEHVTELQIEACHSGLFEHPAWVLRLIPHFHRYYVESLRAWLRHERSAVEAHWLSAFQAMEGQERGRPGTLKRMAYAVAKGMQAHIEEDLPRTLGHVWAQHYAGRCDYVRLRGDYLSMGFVFQDAGARLLYAIPRREWPLRARLLRGVLPGFVQDRWQAREHYDIVRQRRKAFDRGQRIGEMLAAGPRVRAAP
jgi:uncharacterized protein YndB with AHSA1/START domain